MQHPQWKGATSQKFQPGRRHISVTGELNSNLQPTLSNIGTCGIRTFGWQMSQEAKYKPHMKVFPHQSGFSNNQIDLRGKKYLELQRPKQRVRAEKCHVPGGNQTTKQIETRGIRSFQDNGCQVNYNLEETMTRKKRLDGYESLRNNIGVASLGDKPYKYPEYSNNFYRDGGLIPGSTFRPFPKNQKEQQKGGSIFTKPNWDVKVKLDQLEQQRKVVASFDDWEQTTLKEANPKWNDPDTFFERMEVKKETKDQKKGGKK